MCLRSIKVSLSDIYGHLRSPKNDAGITVDTAGPIVLGTQLESSQEPRAWRSITYGKGSWILQMLRRRMGDERTGDLRAPPRRRDAGDPGARGGGQEVSRCEN